tara:strand:- start:433 stop:735 length:303 start_codon:yes stop_codon:yes gene_type:complete
MIITIKNEEGETNFDINNISDDAVKQEATVVVQKVGNLQVIIEALDFASRAHRGNLEALLKDREEAIVETERARNDKGQFVGDDLTTMEDESRVETDGNE